MRNLAAVAERLRAVRRASRRFVQLWAFDRFLIAPALDRIARDLAGSAAASGRWIARRNLDGGKQPDD